MKVLIIYSSTHRGNTEKIARAMAESIDADILSYEEVDRYNILDYDLVGFGSGIYYGKPGKEFVEFIDSLPTVKNKRAFVFTTSGKGDSSYSEKLAANVSGNGFKIVGEFSCKSFDAWGPLKLIGGINKGRPNSDDLKSAQNFVGEIVGKDGS
jgi:flavodoxin